MLTQSLSRFSFFFMRIPKKHFLFVRWVSRINSVIRTEGACRCSTSSENKAHHLIWLGLFSSSSPRPSTLCRHALFSVFLSLSAFLHVNPLRSLQCENTFVKKIKSSEQSNKLESWSCLYALTSTLSVGGSNVVDACINNVHRSSLQLI